MSAPDGRDWIRLEGVLTCANSISTATGPVGHYGLGAIIVRTVCGPKVTADAIGDDIFASLQSATPRLLRGCGAAAGGWRGAWFTCGDPAD